MRLELKSIWSPSWALEGHLPESSQVAGLEAPTAPLEGASGKLSFSELVVWGSEHKSTRELAQEAHALSSLKR